MAMANMNLIDVFVTKLWPVQALACGGGTTKNIISPKFSNFGDIIMGKWVKPDLSDLENDILNNSLKSIFWQSINIIPKKLYRRNKEKLSDCFWENWQKVAKQPNLTFFGPFKMTFRAIQSNTYFDSSLVPSLGSFLHK